MIKPFVAAMCLALSGCGAIYIAPDLSDQLEGTDVTITPLTRDVVVQANRSRYRPRDIPAVFSQNAGGGGALTFKSEKTIQEIGC